MANQLEKFQDVVDRIREKYVAYHQGERSIDFELETNVTNKQRNVREIQY